MFYKYLSDKELECLYKNEGTLDDLKNPDENTINLFTNDIGYYIAYEDLFSTLKEKGIKLGTKDISVALENFNKNINPDYKNLFGYHANRKTDPTLKLFKEDVMNRLSRKKPYNNIGNDKSQLLDIVIVVNQLQIVKNSVIIVKFFFKLITL